MKPIHNVFGRCRLRPPIPIQPQAGLGLISALFIIMVAAMLTVAIARSINTTSAAVGLEIYSLNAFLAAESGAQLAMNELYSPLAGGSCTSRTINLNTVGLTDCEAVITCASETVSSRTYFTVSSAGRCSEGGNLMAQREILVRTQP
ncbi:MAG: hypothetical protein AAF541_12300 [Pseudomonadota bacterium]